MTFAAVGSRPLAELAQEMAERARATFDVDACVIRLIDAEELVLLASAGVARDDLQPRIPIDWGIAREVISRRQPLFVPDVRADPMMAPIMHRVPPPFRFTSYAGAPLITRDRVAGILGIYTANEIRQFSNADLNCLQIFANHIASAIVNDRLYDEMRCQRDQLESETAERQRAEAALRESERRFRSLIENSSDAIVLLAGDGTILYRSPSANRLLGFSAEELVGRGAFHRLHPDDVARVRGLWASLLQHDGDRMVSEFRVQHRDGSWRWIEAVGTNLIAQPSVKAVVINYRDITDRKRAEEALHASERQFRDLLENVRLIAVTLDAQGNTTFCNEYLLALTGWKRDDVLGKSWCEHFLSPDVRERARETYFDGMSRGTIVPHYENEIQTRQGERRLISWNNTVLHGSDGRIAGTASIGEDITERRRIEEERERLSVQLREAQKLEALGRFGRGVAHDFNNLMAIVLGLASHMKSTRPPDHPDVAHLTHIEEAAETASRLAHQLLAFAKGGKIQRRLLPSGDVIKSALVLVQPIIPRDVTVDCDIAADLWPIECDQTQIQQVIVNLCRNALEAMPKGGRLAITAANVVLASPLSDAQPPVTAGEYVCFAVQDSGRGMSTETLGLIFDPFFTTKECGHGLGLAAAHGIVAAHGGGISVVSQLGKGATFRAFLPRAIEVGKCR